MTEARAAATAALDDLALEQNLAPVRKGARVIREIAWRLREIGADGRICDLIDSQVGAIEGAAGKLDSADLAAALNGAFDRIEEKIAGFDADGDGRRRAVGSNVAAGRSEARIRACKRRRSPSGRALKKRRWPMASSEPADAFDANDEAMLDMIAMEMAAPDTDEAYETNLEELRVSDMQVDGGQILASP